MNQARPTCGKLHRPQSLPAGSDNIVLTQTGLLLAGIGRLLINLYSFREHVNIHINEMLVKMGRKLTGE